MTRTGALLALFVTLAAIVTAGVAYDTVRVVQFGDRFARQGAQIVSQEGQIETNYNHQLSNRTANVKLWCSAINTTDFALNAYVAQFAKNGSHVPLLGLKLLPCDEIAAKTQASGHVH